MATDLAALQAKYAQEAQKRIRPEGTAQYEELQKSDVDRLRHLADDVWADHAALDAAPPALKDGDRVKFLIAGAGIGGVVFAARLVQAGFPAESIRIVEAAGGVGGTWYWNRYPGLHCDVESYIYLPLLEEIGFMPSHKYAPGFEIRAYLNQVVEKYGLADKILFRAKLERLAWDEPKRAWRAEIASARGPRGEERQPTLRVEAQFAMLTAGLLARPQVPRLGGVGLAGFEGVGLAGFEGAMLHTARWDYGATGGTPAEAFPALDRLRGKRVGIVGTGATAVQVVPCVAAYAAEVFVFQRTPSAVFRRDQRATDPAEWETAIAAGPGWQRERLLNYAAQTTRSLPPGEPNLVDDEWTRQQAYAALTGDPEFAVVDPPTPERVGAVIGHFLALDEEERARLRARVAEVVRDPDTAARLTPWYPVWCKRPTFSDAYLQAFNEPHVHLVDTDGRGVEAATPRGLVANGGVEYPLDVLVLSTGYTTPAFDGGDPSVRAGVEVAGRGNGGELLSEKWTRKGASTLHGIASSGFPNLFWLGPSQSGVSSNHSFVLETQATHAARIIADAHRKAGLPLDGDGGASSSGGGGVTVEVEEAAEDAWSMRIAAGAARFAAQAVCTPSYINNEGHMAPADASPEALLKRARQAPWSAGFLTYAQEIERWQGEGSMSGVRVTAPVAA